jgi:hypothetical protein
MWSDVIFLVLSPSYLPKEWWADNKQHDTFYNQAHCQEGESQEAQALSLTSGFRSFNSFLRRYSHLQCNPIDVHNQEHNTSKELAPRKWEGSIRNCDFLLPV